MRYSSSDRVQDFIFSCSKLSLVSWHDCRLVLSANHLVVRKDAAPNNSGRDMVIMDAHVTFYSFEINELVTRRALDSDQSGRAGNDEPLEAHKGETALALFMEELRNHITATELVCENSLYKLAALGASHSLSVFFTVSNVTIEWEDCRRKRWYELYNDYEKKLTLSKGNGDICVDATITCPDTDVYSFGEDNQKPPSVSVSIEYGGTEICGFGSDYLWADAFADLQKKLPDGLKIKSCMTCRHGNMCPVGNAPGELFCTKDVIIRQKSDLFFYTEDPDEEKKRSRFCTDVCESFQEQSNDYFTYNDFFLYL